MSCILWGLLDYANQELLQRLPLRVLRTYVVLAEQNVVSLSILYYQAQGRRLKEPKTPGFASASF